MSILGLSLRPRSRKEAIATARQPARGKETTSRENLVASEWVSLDGVFDARTMEQWFNPYRSEGRAEYIQENVQAADAFLLGRVTYEMLAPYWSALRNNEMGIADKLNSAPKYVVSSTLETAQWHNSTIIKGNVEDEIRRLKRRPGQDVLIFGSAMLVHSLIAADLIDEYRFLVHPTIVGSGRRFFKEGMPSAKLRMVKITPLDLGVTLLCYQPVR